MTWSNSSPATLLFQEEGLAQKSVLRAKALAMPFMGQCLQGRSAVRTLSVDLHVLAHVGPVPLGVYVLLEGSPYDLGLRYASLPAVLLKELKQSSSSLKLNTLILDTSPGTLWQAPVLLRTTRGFIESGARLQESTCNRNL
jgi:hypothetical protein